MARKVSKQEKEKMWKLYKELGSYKKVAAKLHRSPDTVSRHVREYEAALRTARVLIDSFTT